MFHAVEEGHRIRKLDTDMEEKNWDVEAVRYEQMFSESKRS